MKIKCEICPTGCVLDSDQRGDCRARINLNDKIQSSSYGQICSLQVDPIEKKPLYHFYPGAQALSFASAGCNLHCKNCQNWEISQVNPQDIASYKFSPQDIVNLAIKKKTPIIAYTYTDPIVHYEFTYDTACLAKKSGIKNVIITCGYINPKPLKKWCEVLDAVKIDLKFFDDKLYREITGARLKPILNAITTIKKQGIWIELVNLIIPTISDDLDKIQQMCAWIKDNLGEDTPLHFSRFFPQYKLNDLTPTPQETLEQAYGIAKDCGLKFVYVGNVLNFQENTYCPQDNNLLISRQGYEIIEYNLLPGGICKSCQKKLPGVWK